MKRLLLVGAAFCLVACEHVGDVSAYPGEAEDAVCALAPGRPPVDEGELAPALERAAYTFGSRGETQLARIAADLAALMGDGPFPELQVYLLDDATDEEVAALQGELEETDNVLGVDYVSKEEAFEEFKDRYRDRPELYELLDPDALPAYLHVDLEDPETARTLMVEFHEHPGVDDVRESEPLGELRGDDGLFLLNKCVPGLPPHFGGRG